MRGIDRRQCRAVFDSCQATGIAMRHDVDGVTVVTANTLNHRQPVLADSGICLFVLGSNRASLVPGRLAPCRRRRLLQHALHARQRPVQVDGRRPCRGQHGKDMVEARIARILRQAERHAVGGGGADQRRAAHLHDANGLGYVFQGNQSQHHGFARQARLVEDQKAVTVLDQGRPARRHRSQLSFP
jgi:hypothetical protein